MEQQPPPFVIRRLLPGDVGLILGLQEEIYGLLPDKTIFQRSSPEFVSYCLGDGGACYVATSGPAVAAYRMVYFPRMREFNLGSDLDFSTEQRLKVAHWDTIAVLPRWRGRGLSRLLNARALEDLKVSDTKHLLATSSPGNPFGISSLIDAGFRPVRLVRKFGNHLRFLFYRPFPAQWPPAARGGQERRVPLDQTEQLVQCFDDGFHGIAVSLGERPAILMAPIDAKPWISHAKPKRTPRP